MCLFTQFAFYLGENTLIDEVATLNVGHHSVNYTVMHDSTNIRSGTNSYNLENKWYTSRLILVSRWKYLKGVSINIVISVFCVAIFEKYI